MTNPLIYKLEHIGNYLCFASSTTSLLAVFGKDAFMNYYITELICMTHLMETNT